MNETPRVEPVLWATTAAGATFLGHVIDEWSTHGLIAARCGERHHHWQMVAEFSRPEVFEPCSACQAD